MNSKKRYHMLALIFGSVVINYLDRTNISVAASAMGESLHFSKIQMGLIFSAFGWTYVTLQIPGGILVDKVRPRLLYCIMLLCWSVVTILQSLVGSFAALLGLRAAIGVFEAPSYPCNNAIVSSWFPDTERASAIAIYTSGQFIGLAFLYPVLATIQVYLGWKGLFVVSGLLGIVWAIVWYVLYRDPDKHPSISKEELAHIRGGGGIQREIKANDWNWQDLHKVFQYRKLWGLYIAQFCMGSVTIFFLTWFPTYLVEFRGLDFIKSGFLASIPFLAAFVGILLSGFTSDFLIKKGYSVEFARKTPVLSGLALSMCIIGANYTNSTPWVIFFLTIAFFGNGLASISWIFVSLMAPKHLIGLVGGVFNLIGGLSAIVIPVLIGYFVEGGNFAPALALISALCILGFVSILFIVGKVTRLEIK
jgi:MFS transporter, ACS family, D-galactonate transporter